jgi:hypothetical protein
MASKGFKKETVLSLILHSPLVGLKTPEMILTRVDLPAPLSPRMQLICPESVVIEIFFNAMTLPKFL